MNRAKASWRKRSKHQQQRVNIQKSKPSVSYLQSTHTNDNDRTNRLKAKHRKLEAEFGKEKLSDFIAQHQSETFKSKSKPVKPRVQNGEEVIFHSDLTPSSKADWGWIRGDSSRYHYSENGLTMTLCPGGLWEAAFTSKPALLLRNRKEACNAYEVRCL